MDSMQLASCQQLRQLKEGIGEPECLLGPFCLVIQVPLPPPPRQSPDAPPALGWLWYPFCASQHSVSFIDCPSVFIVGLYTHQGRDHVPYLCPHFQHRECVQ